MLSLHTSPVALQTRAYPGFLSMKWVGVFVLPSLKGWNAICSQGYSKHLNHQAPFTPLREKRQYESKVSCSKAVGP